MSIHCGVGRQFLPLGSWQEVLTLGKADNKYIINSEGLKCCDENRLYGVTGVQGEWGGGVGSLDDVT